MLIYYYSKFNMETIADPIKNKKFKVNTTVLSQLSKLGNQLNSQTLSENKIHQGLVFGYEDQSSVELNLIYNLILDAPLEELNDKINTFKYHLKNTRLDFAPVGVFSVTTTQSISKETLKLLLKLTNLNPMLVVLLYNPLLSSLSIKKLDPEIVRLNMEAEIRNYLDYPIDVFNKQYSSQILQDVPYYEFDDTYNVLSAFSDFQEVYSSSGSQNKVKTLNTTL